MIDLKSKIILIQAWTLFKYEDKFYIPFTHWVYLKEISHYYNKIVLLSPVKIDSNYKKGMLCIETLGCNVEVVSLPYADGYINSIKYFPSYLKAYKNLKYIDESYVRFPVPFGWLQRLYFKNKKRIIHFAGDPIDAALNNPNFSWLKKRLLVFFFIPEFLMYMWACQTANVFVNGFGISKRLKRFGIRHKNLISSTLNESDFYLEEGKKINRDEVKLLYVGYLRTAKGVEVIINSFEKIIKKYPKSKLTLVGSGEFEDSLKKIVKQKSIENVYFLGHVDDREELNQIFRSHDIFCFASLSEGSPRVILEAMANGINVVSTPVGSLPYIFEDRKEIVFSEFNNDSDFYSKIELLIEDYKLAEKIRLSAFSKVKTFTISKFIQNIFNEA